MTGTSSHEVKTITYVLSLAHAAERRARFAQRSADTQLEWSFFDAHTALSRDLTYDEKQAVRHKGRALKLGELGCYSSHFAMWKALMASGADQCIVLEDDVLVDWPALELAAATDFSSLGHHYVRLYFKRPGRMRAVEHDFLRRSLALVQLYDQAFGTQGYVITRQAAAKFLTLFTEVKRPIDDELDRYFEHGTPNLAIFPPVILEETGPSDIGLDRFDGMEFPPAYIKRLKADKRQRYSAYARASCAAAVRRIQSRIRGKLR